MVENDKIEENQQITVLQNLLAIFTYKAPYEESWLNLMYVHQCE